MTEPVPHPEVSTVDEWVIGPEDTPFFTTRWSPKNDEPKAYVLFVHGFSEHITRYHNFFNRLAAPPSSLHITAFDQRGFGRTSQAPLTASAPDVIAWRKEGKTFKLEKDGKRKSGGWAKVMPDIEWFVRRESELAKSKGKKVFLEGFSMGGAEVVAFATRPQAPPSRETLGLLSGIIVGGPLFRITNKPPTLLLKVGSLAANLGLANMVIPAPVVADVLSHDTAINERAKKDPFCEAVGSVRGVSDMLNGGMELDSPSGWNAWPEDLPILLYHGGDDKITDPKATISFGKNVKAKDKKVEIIEGMYHEVHNEFEPVPTQLANMISQWIDAHIDGPIGSTNETVPGLHDQSRVGGSGSPVDGAVGSSKL